MTSSNYAIVYFLGEVYRHFPANQWTVKKLTEHLRLLFGISDGILVPHDSHPIHPDDLLQCGRKYEYEIHLELFLKFKKSTMELKILQAQVEKTPWN